MVLDKIIKCPNCGKNVNVFTTSFSPTSSSEYVATCVCGWDADEDPKSLNEAETLKLL